ncbi:MAG TPA: fumarylacetoacetate hydrolase family protein [Variovorax sp.]|nr:fumarylacetoacetate hydrolase family protein [Variovorax sp.]
MKMNTLDGLIEALASAHGAGTVVEGAAWGDALSDVEQAYWVQDGVGRALGVFGSEVPRHWKSGGPSRGAALTHAPLPPAGVRGGPARFADMRFRIPGFEAEIALRLGRDVTPDMAAGLAAEDVDALIDAMAVSVEIVDSRWDETGRTFPLLKLADFQSHGALALGGWVPYTPRDWSRQTCRVHIEGSEPRVFTGTHSLGEPQWLLPHWLRHVTRGGKTVSAGTVVTTGTWCGLIPLRPDAVATVEFEGIGTLDVRLAGG